MSNWNVKVQSWTCENLVIFYRNKWKSVSFKDLRLFKDVIKVTYTKNICQIEMSKCYLLNLLQFLVKLYRDKFRSADKSLYLFKVADFLDKSVIKLTPNSTCQIKLSKYKSEFSFFFKIYRDKYWNIFFKGKLVNEH